MVVDMNLNDLVRKHINFNSTELQVYPPNNGFLKLRNAINGDYFDCKSDPNNISITNGGMSGLDLIIKTLGVDTIYTPKFYWGAYKNIIIINGKNKGNYENFEDLRSNVSKYKDQAVIICDPNNPIGDKYSDDLLLDTIKTLNDNGVIVIYDSPYRKLFIDDNTFYKEIFNLNNVIINESFSKRFGLSGQRIGFVHSNNISFIRRFNINLLYSTNGINVFSQVLIEKLLTTKEGKKSYTDFTKKTTTDIKKNINYLIDNKLLASDFYNNSIPMGIFVIINIPHDKLMENYIGSVSLSFFTDNKEDINPNYSRICVSVDNESFETYFNKMLK
jgi:aspartate/methionine/tyrosine aminotransferase